MNYSSKICITIPSGEDDLYEIACSIARALDPDVGGHNNFGPKFILGEDGEYTIPDKYTTGFFPCTEKFAMQASVLINNPEMLHSVVSADYSNRWPDLISPTLEECKEFCLKVVIE